MISIAKLEYLAIVGSYIKSFNFQTVQFAQLFLAPLLYKRPALNDPRLYNMPTCTSRYLSTADISTCRFLIAREGRVPGMLISFSLLSLSLFKFEYDCMMDGMTVDGETVSIVNGIPFNLC